MTQRLWVQLSAAFAVVTLASVLTVALLANARADTVFRGYLANSQVLATELPARLADYYVNNQDWAGVERLLRPGQGMGGQGMGGQGMGGPLMRGLSLALADAGGRIVVAGAGLSEGTLLSEAQRRDATPIIAGGQPVGYLLARSPAESALPAVAERFLDQINLALWQAGLLAGGLGLLLGLLIARRLAAPLDRLALAARGLAQGRLHERVLPEGPVEARAAAAAFNEMAGALERGEQQRRQMVADIAHELRTPLSVIQGNLRALLDDVYPLSKAEVTTIYDTTIGLRRLVDDLRELSLAEAGQLSLHMQPVDSGGLLRRAVALFGESAAGQGITLQSDIEPDLPPVTADPDRLAQVLHNLLANALRHTPPGGSVTLRMARAGAGVVRFEVADTGPGIAPEDLPRLFERFWRADQARSRARGGSGLGLAIARQIVRLHGGEIGAMSAPGEGACFWFTLPVARPGSPAAHLHQGHVGQ